MQEKRNLTQELNLVKDLHMLAQAYEEISVVKMQSTRDRVIKTRAFLADLSSVFYDVKSSYKSQIAALVKKAAKNKTAGKQTLTTSTLPKNGKNVAVFLSANAHFYGDIIKKVFELFIFDINQRECDIVIVGKLGKDLYDQQRIVTKTYTYYDVPDTKVTLGNLQELVAAIIKYDTVTVYYGKFVNVLTQEPSTSSVTGEELFDTVPQADKQQKFIFEPSLEKILNFFETQIFSSLFTQTTHEAELARYGSRIRAMEEALENIEERSLVLARRAKRVKNLTMNRKQTQALAGITLWRDKM